MAVPIDETVFANKKTAAHLKPYQFQPGHAPYPGAGRPKGSRDAATIYLESLPRKARQWVKSTDARILSEARQLTASVEEEPRLLLPSDRVPEGSGGGSIVIVF